MVLTLDQINIPHLRVYQRAGDGAWLAEGVTNREGIYLYEQDGKTIRELRTAETVRNMTPKIARAVVTLGHPDIEVTPDTVTDLAHGDVDATYDTPDQGGFVVGVNRVALRSRDAIALAERGALKGFSPGYIAIRDNTPGHDPKWGPYDRVLIDVASVNHLALCGDSYALPPARGGNDVCTLFLDSMPRAEAQSMRFKTTKDRVQALASDAAKPIVARLITGDKIDLNELVKIAQAAMANPESPEAIVLHALVNKPAEVAEIQTGMEPLDDGAMPPAFGAEMDAKIAAALKPVKDALAVLTADKATRDAIQTSAADALLREQASKIGVKDAGTLAIDALVPAMGARLALDLTGLDHAAARTVVSRTAALRAAQTGPALPTRDAAPVVSAAQIGV